MKLPHLFIFKLTYPLGSKASKWGVLVIFEVILLSTFLFLLSSVFVHATTVKNAGKNGLVGYWPFNEGTGTTAQDVSGKGNNGTLLSGPIWVTGKLGKALKFNGGSYVSTGYTPQSGAKSLSYWIYYNTVSTGDFQIQGSQEVGAYFYNGIQNGGQGYFYTGNNGGLYNYFFKAGRWYQVGMTMEETGGGVGITHLYVNGVQVDTLAYTASNNSTLNFYIGALHGGASPTYPFNATIDDFRIYNRTLSASEISDLYKTGGGVIKSITAGKNGLVGYWPMNEGTSTQTGDASGFRNTAVFNGSISWTQGKMGKALRFSGGNEYVNAATMDISNSNFRSASYWIYPISFPANAAALTTSNFYHLVGFSAGDLSTVFPDTGKRKCSSPLTIGSWQFVYVDLVNDKIYKNGVDCSTVFAISWGPDPYTGLMIGHSYVAYPAPNAYMDDVRVYNRVLTNTEIYDLYNSGGQAVANAPRNNVLTNGLIGLWSFDGKDTNWTSSTAGTVLDRVGGHTGTFNNMFRDFSPVIGKIGQAMNFNGNSQYVTADLTSLGTLSRGTLALWVKKTTTGGILTEGTGSKPSFEGNPVTFYVNNDCATPTTSMPVGVWYFLTGTWDGSYARTYVNGNLSGGPTACSSSAVMGSFSIGARNVGSVASNGAIDDVRIYNRALSASEIKSLYNQGQ